MKKKHICAHVFTYFVVCNFKCRSGGWRWRNQIHMHMIMKYWNSWIISCFASYFFVRRMHPFDMPLKVNDPISLHIAFGIKTMKLIKPHLFYLYEIMIWTKQLFGLISSYEIHVNCLYHKMVPFFFCNLLGNPPTCQFVSPLDCQ